MLCGALIQILDRIAGIETYPLLLHPSKSETRN